RAHANGTSRYPGIRAYARGTRIRGQDISLTQHQSRREGQGYSRAWRTRNGHSAAARGIRLAGLAFLRKTSGETNPGDRLPPSAYAAGSSNEWPVLSLG